MTEPIECSKCHTNMIVVDDDAHPEPLLCWKCLTELTPEERTTYFASVGEQAEVMSDPNVQP